MSDVDLRVTRNSRYRIYNAEMSQHSKRASSLTQNYQLPFGEDRMSIIYNPVTAPIPVTPGELDFVFDECFKYPILQRHIWNTFKNKVATSY